MDGNSSAEEPRNAVKKERIHEDIKDFAETAMNELLGWYGYGGGAREDARSLTKRRRRRSRSGTDSSGPDSPKRAEGCGWCGKPVEDSQGISSGLASFCSELCFSQSRRASFKKNKTCDWCRHVRHTVSYVDFQDGASQLQFCSDKCLNQYKMHIFCRETEAHLEVHPHLPPAADEKPGGGLITPDLWLKNCRSPDSRTSTPPPPPQDRPLPLISVAPASKLMAAREPDPQKRPRPPKRARKRQTPEELPQDLRVRQPQREQRTAPPPAKPTAVGGPEVPPVTVLVPYPVVVPFPLPIPIPIPLPLFAKGGAKENEGGEKGDDGGAEENKEEEEVRGRPLRKRKKAAEGKSRIANKKKGLAV